MPSGLTTYLLVLYLTAATRRLRWLFDLRHISQPDGAVYCAFCAVITYLFPLCALYMIKVKRRPNIRNAFIFGLLLGLCLLVNIIHIAYLLLPLVIIFVAYWFVSRAARFLAGTVSALFGARASHWLSAQRAVPVAICGMA